MTRAPKNLNLIAYALNMESKISRLEPQSYEEAMSMKDVIKWKKAMEEKMSSTYKNKRWTLVPRSKSRKVMGKNWVYKVKEGVLDVNLAHY